MPFYYYRNSKFPGRAVSGEEKDLKLALIGYCGYFHSSLYSLSYSFVGNLGTDHQKTYGEWGGGRSTKKNIRARENQTKKNSCTPINPKKYSCYGLKKIHTRNLITKKSSCGSKIPLPPAHNFSNGPFLTEVLRYSADTFSRVKARHMI